MPLESIAQPIKAKTLEEHRVELEKKLELIKLEYIDKLFTHQISEMEERSKDLEFDNDFDEFSFYLNQYSDILDPFIYSYNVRMGFETSEKRYNEVLKIKENHSREIYEIYKNDHDHWIKKALLIGEKEKKDAEAYISEQNKKELEAYLGNADRQITTEDPHLPTENEYARGSAGIINYGVKDEYSDYFNGTAFSIKPNDVCISIHLDPLYTMTVQDTSKNIFSSSSLEKLAVQIVDKHPEAKAIVARSWLVDTPIAERIGLTVYKKEKEISPAFWGQFIDAKGQINQKRVENFLETGHADYDVALGAISTEDFLRKYLPKERRGKITLKAPNPDFDENKYKEDSEMVKQMIRGWIALNEDTVKEMLSERLLLKEFNDDSLGQGFFDSIIKWKRENKTEAQVTENINKFYQPLQKFLMKKKFINKEVIID